MSIQITARTFTSGSDIIRSAAALNARLHRPAREFVCVRPPARLVEQEAQIGTVPALEAEREDADWHVRTYAYWLARLADGDDRQHILDRCELWGVKLSDILEPNQANSLSEARAQLAWELAAHIIPGETLHHIGKLLGGRDHSTMRQIIGRYERRMSP